MRIRSIRITPTVGLSLLLLCLLLTDAALAQDGEAGIREATTKLKRYFETAQTLLYAIGGVIGLIGAIKVYSKWSHGDNDTTKTAAAWFSACIFLVVVATVLKSFFGLN
ncbi:DUF4134 domain-containing protein [Chitinophaga lutea]|uniref:DUF4134 domain-containing protein n=1 Tax=Chitinophaga lutea TaxID=2488634 RepID=A0A3N4PZ74_9BACT|nr:DUF4134 domain-containing protein [Chitinophaga lutea]RPE13176.1 DUF4134 domain-containing protein [Chitinophaga lutea]